MNRFDKYAPDNLLKRYVKYFAISENAQEQTYRVLPDTALVIGIQYRGKLSTIRDGKENALAQAGVTGLQDRYRVFKNTANIGTLLIFFTETGASSFFNAPLHEVFAQSVALDHFFSQSLLNQVSDQLAETTNDLQKIRIISNFLVSHLRYEQEDLLVTAAVDCIKQSGGTIRIRELAARLHISQGPLEKRFRKTVGATPKKFASIIRLQSLIQTFPGDRNLTGHGLENGYYDQAHFIKDFKLFTGDTPKQFFGRK